MNLGRWTTPDPVATPWWNLPVDVCDPIEHTDPNGLKTCSRARAMVLAGKVALACGVGTVTTILACVPETMTVVLLAACVGTTAYAIYECVSAINAIVDECGDGANDKWVDSWRDFFSVAPQTSPTTVGRPAGCGALANNPSCRGSTNPRQSQAATTFEVSTIGMVSAGAGRTAIVSSYSKAPWALPRTGSASSSLLYFQGEPKEANSIYRGRVLDR